MESVIEDTVRLACAYLGRNEVPAEMLPEVLETIYQTLSSMNGIANLGATPLPRPEPVVPIKKSVFPDHLVCLECGVKLKMLTRHVKQHGLTVDEYKKRWELGASYPTVADAYSRQRSQMAKSFGLGRKRKGKK